MLEPASCRLSVIIPVRNQRAFAERSVQSVLNQTDPIGTEIILVDGGSRDGTAEHVRTLFGEAVNQEKLRIRELDPTGDPARMRNEGAKVARGSFLTFLNPLDQWLPGRLLALEPHLNRHDLILGMTESIPDSADWLRHLISNNGIITSASVIRSTLFEEVGGFPEGYFGLLLPKKVPGAEDFELWVKCLVRLAKTGKKDRVALVRNQSVHLEEAGFPIPGMEPPISVQSLRETVSLLRLAPKVPPRYWKSLGQRALETSKQILKKERKPG